MRGAEDSEDSGEGDDGCGVEVVHYGACGRGSHFCARMVELAWIEAEIVGREELAFN